MASPSKESPVHVFDAAVWQQRNIGRRGILQHVTEVEMGGISHGSHEAAHGRNHFLRRAEVGAVTGGIQDDQPAVRYRAMNKIADFKAGDDVFLALEDKRRLAHMSKVIAVIGRERDPREGLRDFWVCATKAAVPTSPCGSIRETPAILRSAQH